MRDNQINTDDVGIEAEEVAQKVGWLFGTGKIEVVGIRWGRINNHEYSLKTCGKYR